eukprot:UN10309
MIFIIINTMTIVQHDHIMLLHTYDLKNGDLVVRSYDYDSNVQLLDDHHLLLSFVQLYYDHHVHVMLLVQLV